MLSFHNRVFSCDITAATLVSLNKGTAAMLVSPTNSPGIELCCVIQTFSFVSVEKQGYCSRVGENTLYPEKSHKFTNLVFYDITL